MHSWRLSFKQDLLHTSYFQNTVEHRKPAKTHLRLKDNKPCLVSSGHFLRTDRLVHTRHLVHVANGRCDLAPNTQTGAEFPQRWTHTAQDTQSSSAAIQRRTLKKQVSNLCQSRYFLSVPMVSIEPLRRGLHASEQHALSPQSNLGCSRGVTGRWQSTVVLRLKAKRSKFLPLRCNGLLTRWPPCHVPSALQRAG